MTIKVLSEYARQFQWPDVTPVIEAEGFVAGVPSYAEHIHAEPALKTKSKATLELVHEARPAAVDICGSPSKELHITREPSFIKKKSVPGMSPERVKIKKSDNKALAARAGLLKQGNSSRFKSEYAARYSPKKGAQIVVHESPLQSALSIVHQSHTNLPIGEKPDKKVQSEYAARYPDPTSELKYLRAVYREELRKKEVQIEKEEAAEGSPVKKVQLKICSPLRKDKPVVRVDYDIISPHKPVLSAWRSEYNSQYVPKDHSPTRPVKAPEGSPAKSSPAKLSSQGKRSHPYKQPVVAELLQPDVIPAEPLPSPDLKSWYEEVVELRKLAEKFKAKSHGSHFSPKKLGNICYSSAQLRVITPPLTPVVSDESIGIIPQEKKKTVELPQSVPAVAASVVPAVPVAEPVTEPAVTEDAPVEAPAPAEVEAPAAPAEVEAPAPTVEAPAAPVTNMLDLVLPEGSIIAKRTSSLCSTPRSIIAERSNTLFSERVTTPHLIASKTSGSRHHLDRTTKSAKPNPVPVKDSIIAGRCETPRLQEIGGYRHHLDGTTPSVMNCKSLMESLKKEAAASVGTQPFDPHLINDGGTEVSSKLDFSSPVLPKPPARKAWVEDLDSSVLSRASSCTSIAAATLEKAKRGGDVWK